MKVFLVFAILVPRFPIPTFQWKLDGEPIKDATNRVYKVERAWNFDEGKYSVVATNKHGSMESEPLTIEVDKLSLYLNKQIYYYSSESCETSLKIR